MTVLGVFVATRRRVLKRKTLAHEKTKVQVDNQIDGRLIQCYYNSLNEKNQNNTCTGQNDRSINWVDKVNKLIKVKLRAYINFEILPLNYQALCSSCVITYTWSVYIVVCIVV